MFSRFGSGRAAGSGNRGGIGFGFRGSSPPSPYTGRGGLPRCAYYTGVPESSVPVPGAALLNREEELNLLKRQARDIKDNLERINSRVRDLESEQQRN